MKHFHTYNSIFPIQLFHVMFFSGSTLGEISVDECLDFIAEAINNAHGKTKYTSAGNVSNYCRKKRDICNCAHKN